MSGHGRTLAWVFVAACVVAGGWTFAQLAQRAGAGGAQVPPGSARRYDPYGTAALAETLRRLDRPVRHLERPRLEAGTRGLLLRVLGVPQPGIFRDSEDETEAVYDLPAAALLAWVAEGNVLVSAGRGPRAVAEELGVTVRVDPDASDTEAAQRAGLPPEELVRGPITVELDLSPLVPGAAPRRLGLRAPAAFEAGADRPFSAEAVDATGAIRAAAVRHGRGTVVLIGAPDPFQTAFVQTGDHLELALDLLALGPPSSTVWFDEWAHGLGHAGSLVEVLVALGLVPLGVQAGGWLIAYGWSRRGRRVLRPATGPQTGGGAVGQAEALGRLVRAHGTAEQAAAEVAAEVRHRLATALRCPPAAVEARLGEGPAATAARRVLKDAASEAGRAVPRCRACRFPLQGGPDTATCPECGEPLSSAQRRRLADAGGTQWPAREEPDRSATWARLGGRLAEAAEAAEALVREAGRPGPAGARPRRGG